MKCIHILPTTVLIYILGLIANLKRSCYWGYNFNVIGSDISMIIHVTPILFSRPTTYAYTFLSDFLLFFFFNLMLQIGLECQVSVEELAVEVQQSFFQDTIYTYEL